MNYEEFVQKTALVMKTFYCYNKDAILKRFMRYGEPMIIDLVI